jgi:hypothetical protein
VIISANYETNKKSNKTLLTEKGNTQLGLKAENIKKKYFSFKAELEEEKKILRKRKL